MPRYYERDRDGLPAAWLAIVRASIRSTVWQFSTTRMLEEYIEQLYLPAAREAHRSAREGRPRAPRRPPSGGEPRRRGAAAAGEGPGAGAEQAAAAAAAGFAAEEYGEDRRA